MHHGDAVTHGDRLLLVVGDVDKGDAYLTLQVLQLDLHLLAELQVESPEGLIKEQHLGAVDQGPGQGHPLLLAAGELCRLSPRQAVHLDQSDGPVDQLGPFRSGNLAHLQPEPDVTGHVHMGEKGIVLEHGVDRPLVGRTEAHLLSVDTHRPLGR